VFYRRSDSRPDVLRCLSIRESAIFAALERAGVEFHHDGKRFGVSISVRKVTKGLTK
jgi:hypothetical protein